MRQNLPKTLFATLAAAVLSLPISIDAQIRYELVVPEILGNPVSNSPSRGNEINVNGETLLNRVATFAVWKDGAITQIASVLSEYPATLSRIDASSINRFHQVVGTKTYKVAGENGSRFDTFPFYWDSSNGVVDLDDLGNRSDSGAGSTSLYAINKEGLAIGTTQIFQGENTAGNQAFAWSFATGRIDIAPLDTLDSQSVTTPESINDFGAVVGTYRKFADSTSHYFERAFLFDEINGSIDLAELDEEFFAASHITARDINNHAAIVGERDRLAYYYELENGVGYSIENPNSETGSARAYAVNDRKVVTGSASTAVIQSSLGNSPYIWTRETGSIDLGQYIAGTLSDLLPESISRANVSLTPNAINDLGQISASLETNTTFSREVVLNPVLDFQWDSMIQKAENGVHGVLYMHDKSQLDGAIPASALGYTIAFECSPDMQNWSSLELNNAGIRHLETSDSIELFIPFEDCVFIRPVLVSETD